MKKKLYFTPTVEKITVEVSELLAGSGKPGDKCPRGAYCMNGHSIGECYGGSHGITTGEAKSDWGSIWDDEEF